MKGSLLSRASHSCEPNAEMRIRVRAGHGLTLVHFAAQPKPFLALKNSLNPRNPVDPP
jgi:hypothetical protein